MRRRSISLFPMVETQVRDFQAKLLTKLDRDVSFTEALNMMLLGAVALGADKHIIEKFGVKLINGLLDSTGLSVEALVDTFQDKILEGLQQASQQPLPKKS